MSKYSDFILNDITHFRLEQKVAFLNYKKQHLRTLYAKLRKSQQKKFNEIFKSVDKVADSSILNAIRLCADAVDKNSEGDINSMFEEK